MPTPHPCRLQVWLASPADYFAQFPEADVLVSSDALDTQLQPGDSDLELPHAAHTAMNIGAPCSMHSHAFSQLAPALDLRSLKLAELPDRLPARLP